MRTQTLCTKPNVEQVAGFYQARFSVCTFIHAHFRSCLLVCIVVFGLVDFCSSLDQFFMWLLFIFISAPFMFISLPPSACLPCFCQVLINWLPIFCPTLPDSLVCFWAPCLLLGYLSSPFCIYFH